MSGAQYAKLVPRKLRSPKLPKIDRKWRPRMIAWAGPAAFYPNRFYEIDKWYKARIDKPMEYPQLHIIDPANHMKSLDEIIAQDVPSRIDIGFAARERQKPLPLSEEARAELERQSRKLQLLVDLDKVADADDRIFTHARLLDDIFGAPVFFRRVQHLSVAFGEHSVYTGNVLYAADTKLKPQVELESIGSDGFNTLLAINVDGNPFEERKGEILHWLVANIPDGKGVEEGEERVQYMQALPFCGSGYHRLAFLLFRHSTKINVEDDYGNLLSDRVFSSAEFYKKHEEVLTPSSILFSQVHYDLSVKECLHGMGMKSPLYEYEYNPPAKREQKEFPKKPMPFDLYLDQYRDPKDLQHEILTERFRRFGTDEPLVPELLDENYAENRKTLEPWRHAQLLERRGRFAGIYDNALKE